MIENGFHRWIGKPSHQTMGIIGFKNGRIPGGILLRQPGRRHPKLRSNLFQPTLVPPGKPKQLALIMPRHAPERAPVKQIVVHEKHHPLRGMTFQKGLPGWRHIPHEHYLSTRQLKGRRQLVKPVIVYRRR